MIIEWGGKLLCLLSVIQPIAPEYLEVKGQIFSTENTLWNFKLPYLRSQASEAKKDRNLGPTGLNVLIERHCKNKILIETKWPTKIQNSLKKNILEIIGNYLESFKMQKKTMVAKLFKLPYLENCASEAKKN